MLVDGRLHHAAGAVALHGVADLFGSGQTHAGLFAAGLEHIHHKTGVHIGFAAGIHSAKLAVAADVPDIAWDLISVSDKPLTIIYSSAKNLATNLLGADGSVGIRITNEEFSKKLCERFRKPLVSTSANVSGEPSPANFSEVSEVIKEGVDYIVSYRQDDMSKAAPSGIIKLGAGGLVQVIR